MQCIFKRVFFLSVLSLFFQLDALQVRPRTQNEWGILDVVAEILPKNPTVIQAGYYADATQKMGHLWPRGKLYIFEPNPKHFQQFKEKHRYHPNVEIFPVALSKETGYAPFYIGPSVMNARIGSLLPATDEWKWYYSDAQKIIVECKNLQDWADAQGVDFVDFFWLDIGGMELDVLKSIPKLIKNISMMLVETHEKEFRQGIGLFKDVVSFLDEHDIELIHQWKTPGFQGYSLFMKRGFAEVVK
ncbi:MAG: FkbM family methyltransferase [Chlamydiota bacterium]